MYDLIRGIFISLFVVVVFTQTQGTQSFYASPKSMSRAYDIQMSLSNLQNSLSISNISYESPSKIFYTMKNIKVKCVFNGGKQNGEIKQVNNLFVAGGKIQFIYNFEFQKGNTTNGSGYGSVYSNSIQYGKKLGYNDKGYLIWQLTPWSLNNTNISITDQCKIKRLNPYDQIDFSILESMISGGTNVQPATVKDQIITNSNKIFIKLLNDTLNHQSFGEEIIYNYTHPYQGILQLHIVHQLKKHIITPNDGVNIAFITSIKDYGATKCNYSVPQNHISFQLYGGLQNVHLNCFYESVIDYILSKGWLNTELDQRWQSIAFQFYAGDLYDLINNLYLRVQARSALIGNCTARKEFTFGNGKSFQYNTYQLDLTYDCLMSSISKEKLKIDVLKFSTKIRYYIQPSAQTFNLQFKIIANNIIDLNFIPVQNFFVNDITLAKFKITQALKSLINHTTFGTGFPTIPRQVPYTFVRDANYVVYSDMSHINQQNKKPLVVTD